MIALTPPAPDEHAPYFSRYIDLVHGDALSALATQVEESLAVLRRVPADDSRRRYAPGKWSLREVVGHLIDTERVFAYRALRFARGEERSIPGFEPDPEMAATGFDTCAWPDLLDEMAALRRADVLMFRGFPAEAFQRRGLADGKVTSVRALAYCIAGHELHHMRIIRERYL